MYETHLPEPVAWNIRPDVDQQALYHFLECVMEIAHTLRSLATTWQPGTEATIFVSAPLAIAASRSISTSIRKTLLDGNGALFKKCFAEPNIHPLIPPSQHLPMNFKRHFEEQTCELQWSDGQLKTITVPKFDHTTTVYPLRGVHHLSGTNFAKFYPFDHNATPVKFKKWMNAKIIEIDGQGFSAKQVLRDMSNKEGAHIENNHALIVPSDISIDSDQNTLHRLANGVTFGSLTYLQIFTIFTGLYIVNRTRPTLHALPFPDNHEAVQFICDTINNSPRNLTSTQSPIQITSYPLAVLGHDRDVRGDYSAGVTTTIRAPEPPLQPIAPTVYYQRVDSTNVIANSTIATGNNDRHALHDAGIATWEGRIAAIGAGADVRQAYPDAQVASKRGKALFCRSINCHPHLLAMG